MDGCNEMVDLEMDEAKGQNSGLHPMLLSSQGQSTLGPDIPAVISCMKATGEHAGETE